MRFFKILAIGSNILLLFMFATYFMGHGIPTNPILISSATVWLVVPIINLIYILKFSVNKIR